MKKFYIGIFATALMSGSALAHTPPPPPAPAPIMTVASYSTSAFDWNGFYMGVGLGMAGSSSGVDPTLTGVLGVNFVLDNNIVAGVEVNGLLYLDGSGDSEVYLDGRLGVLASDTILLYGLAGIGAFNADFSDPLYNLGLGAEVAVTDVMSIRGEVRVNDFITGGSMPPGFFDASIQAIWNF